jgi:hypothetical protein
MNSTYNASHIRTCTRCHALYDWRRSTSHSLKMTYCNALCEGADLGFTMEALFKMEWQPVLKAA